MLYVQVIRNEGKVVSATVVDQSYRADAECRCNWNTFEAAKKVAAALGDGFLATDAGPYCSPRYDVIALPKIGDEVSYSFNGDTYPCGKIVSISKSLKLIKTDSGEKFYRLRETGSWKYNQTWFLVKGHINERNPSF